MSQKKISLHLPKFQICFKNKCQFLLFRAADVPQCCQVAENASSFIYEEFTALGDARFGTPKLVRCR